ncbi:MAG: PAS domain S-box protein, partial [Methanoregula sp.]|nr:PAS domain S-box protein [Methanoregula sp.]
MAEKIRALYVDDELTLLELAKLFLERSGDFTVTIATSAPEAIRLLEQETFDAIVSDYQMPEMDGIEFLKHLKAEGNTTPFIIFTGKGREEVVIEALNAGADFYIQKGGESKSQFAELSHKIKKAVEGTQRGEALRVSEEKYRSLFDEAADLIAILDTQGTFLNLNKKFEEESGYQREEIIGKNVLTFGIVTTPSVAKIAYHLSQIVLGKEVPIFEIEGLNKNNEIIPYEIRATPIIKNGKVTGAQAILRNLTERKRVETELARVNRALRMLSDFNQALIHITDEALLMNEICRLAVEVGGYRMAWIGFAEQDEAKTVRPVAHAGFESGYIESANISWADSERGRGPGGTAIRTGQMSMARNISVDPAFAPWRADAILRGYQSVIVLPLTGEGRTFGALAIYASEVDAFDSEEVEILKELVDDLSFGITSLRTKIERKRTEEALRESEEAFRALAENASDGFLVATGNGIHVFANKRAAEITGYSVDELVNISIRDLAHHREFDRVVYDRFKKIMAGEPVPKLYETVIVRKDGKEVPIEVTSAKTGWHGQPVDLVIIRDITERKRAEDSLRHVTRLYTLISQINQAIVRTREQDELFRTICQVSTESGQFRMAWVGLTDEANDRIKPVAYAGHEDGYLDQILITTGDTPTGKGPTGSAFREGKIITSSDIATEPQMLPWRDEALKRGYRSSAAIPLKRKGKPVGTLSFYASEPSFFTADEQRLLQEIGDDISFALDAMTSETERKQAEEVLRIAQEKYTKAFLSVPDAITISELDSGRFIEVNDAATRIFGYSRDELIGKSTLELSIWRNKEDRDCFIGQVRKHGKVSQVEVLNQRKSGEVYYALVNADTISIGNVPYLIAIIRDI